MAGEPHLWLKSAIEDASGLEAFPVEKTTGGEPPYVVYVRDATESETLLDDDLGSEPEPSQFPALAAFTVVVFADKYVDAWSYARSIYLALNRFRDLSGSQIIESVYVDDKRDGEITYLDGREQATYSVELDVAIRFIED